MPQLAGNHSVFEALRLSSYGVQSGFFSYLLGISVPLMIAGLVVMNGLVPRAANRSELSWYRAALPVFELLLIIFCTAFMIMD
jgi:hypothetical protein